MDLLRNYSSEDELSDREDESSNNVDYFNLDCAPTNDENNIKQNEVDVTSILNEAKILNDTFCGPIKPLDRETCEPLYINSQLINKSDDSPKIQVSNGTSHYKRKDIENDNDIVVLNEESSKKFKNTIDGKQDVQVKEKYYSTSKYISDVSNHLPKRLEETYHNNDKPISVFRWCISLYGHLFLTASINGALKIWDTSCKSPVHIIDNDLKIKAAKWTLDGRKIVAGGYGKKCAIFDATCGKEINSCNGNNYISSIEIHPEMSNIFLCGTRNKILGFDFRINPIKPIKYYMSKCEDVLDIAFLNSKEFICSSSVVSRDSADRTIMAWDFAAEAILSNQIYLERYTCPSLKVHPHEPSFIAQTNGNYIADFYAQRPYKIKNKKYSGHKVSGYDIQCDISPDGKFVTSGDAEGKIYFYNYATTHFLKKITVNSGLPVNRVQWHPELPSTIGITTWDGDIQIWK